MFPKFISSVLLISLLAACAPAAPVATEPPVPTALPPTEAPPPLTETLTSTPEPTATLGENLKYSKDYLAQFQNVQTKLVIVGGVAQDGLVGTYPDGKERILGLNINGTMTRVGESTDSKGHKFYTYVNPNYDPLLRMLPTEQTSGVLFDFMLKNLVEGQFKNETGGDPEKLKDIIFNETNNGLLSFQVPVANPQGGDWAVKWVTPEVKADFTKPVEIITVMGNDTVKLNEIRMANNIIDFRADDFIFGGLVEIAIDGHIQIFVVSGRPEDEWYIRGIPKNSEEKKYILEAMRTVCGRRVFSMLNLLDDVGNKDVFRNKGKYSNSQFDNMARSFEYSVDLK